MIIKVLFQNEDGAIEMLFGNSYKPWTMQYREYFWSHKVKPITASESRAKWIAYGGLKWCSVDEFQEELNKENPTKPRQFSKMRFKKISIDKLPK